MAYYAITAIAPRWNYETNSEERRPLHLILRSGENGMTFVVDEHVASAPLDLCDLCVEEIDNAASRERY